MGGAGGGGLQGRESVRASKGMEGGKPFIVIYASQARRKYVRALFRFTLDPARRAMYHLVGS
jgi:hypothetical protein